MIEIIGVDMALGNSQDYSAVSFYCSNCNTIIGLKVYEPSKNEIDVTLFKEFPVCKSKFKKYIINN